MRTFEVRAMANGRKGSRKARHIPDPPRKGFRSPDRASLDKEGFRKVGVESQGAESQGSSPNQ